MFAGFILNPAIDNPSSSELVNFTVRVPFVKIPVLVLYSASGISFIFDVNLNLGDEKENCSELISPSALPLIREKTDIVESISGIENADLESVKNWYSDYSKLSPTEQVFRCQQTNIRWDAELRSEFKWLVVISSGVILLLLAGMAIAINPTFVKCISVLAWMLPIADISFGYYDGLRKDIKRLEAIRQQSNIVENALSNGETCESKIINLQTLIMENRANAVLIPDWYYNKRQDAHQKKEDSIADTVQKMSSEGGGEK